MGAEFRAHILGLRQARNRTITQAAEAAGLDGSTVSRLERGERAPTRETIAHLARGYGLTTAEHDALLILGGFTPADPAALVADEPDVAALYRALRGDVLDSATKDRLRRLIAAALALAAGR